MTKKTFRCSGALVLASVVAFAIPLRAAPLEVSSTSPSALSVAPVTTSISITFDRPLDAATVSPSSFRVYGRWSGLATGALSFTDAGATVTLNPEQAFMAGEPVFVNLASTIRDTQGEPLRASGFAYQFVTAVRASTRTFTEIDSFSNRTTPGAQTRIYGAAGADLNHDGYPDLTTVNEVSADLRVFLNRADGTGLYDSFLTPFPIGVEASPNEPGDFDNDGNVDLAVAASSSNSVWICLGAGDGTWVSAQEIPVGAEPHGLAVLDVDGDADLDVVTANTSGNNLSLMINDGSGSFAPSTSFESGGDGEYGLAAGDMDGDGITDLVVGSRFSQDIRVLRGNGDGTFTMVAVQGAGGLSWMLALGDLNGDGLLDVTSANSQSGNASVLMGTGGGLLDEPVTMAVAAQVIATDLGDLDGDGDMDWVLSSFGGGVWNVYTNDGLGNFTFDQQFDAISNPSCAVMLDIDRDDDLDLVLTDEIADVVRLEQNQSFPPGPPGAVPDGADVAGVPLSVNKAAGTQLKLSWGHSCRPGDLDYEVYEGSIGLFYSHESLVCGTGGATAQVVTPADGNTYYLVVPNDGVDEGSYGTASSSQERPPALEACLPQNLPSPVCP